MFETREHEINKNRCTLEYNKNIYYYLPQGPSRIDSIFAFFLLFDFPYLLNL